MNRVLSGPVCFRVLSADGHCLFLVLLLMNGSSERSCLAYVKCPDLYLRTRTGPLFCPNLFCPISFFIFHFITLLQFYFKFQLNTFSNSVFSHDFLNLQLNIIDFFMSNKYSLDDITLMYFDSIDVFIDNLKIFYYYDTLFAVF